ncbi:MAG: hypothetical protein OQJ81_12050 [Melioribacteraceae bacterium]|nr:hypothetical protein [Melioribacteraceae bacterium]
MKKILYSSIFITLLVLFSGFAAGGAFQTSHVTSVELSEPNFNIVARDLSGMSMQGYILGLSISQGSDVGLFGFVKVAGVEKLYDTAIMDLWKNYEKKYGEREGKKLALVNIRQDSEILNTILYTQAKYFITADVVEFVD